MDGNNKSSDTISQIIKLGIWKEGEPLRLHLGCGENHFDGYINIDYPSSEHPVQTKVAADLFADLTHLDFPDSSVDEIRLHHVFEHFGRPKALAILTHWHRWLKIGGKLHIETPDLMGCARRLVSDLPYKTKQATLRHMFGSHEAFWAYHLDGWYKEKFEHILSKFGFSVQCQNMQWEGDPWLSNVHALAVKEKQIGRDTLLKIADEILIDSMVADVPGERLMHQEWCRMVRDELGKMLPDTDSMAPPALGIAGITIVNDAPAYDNIGYDNIEFKENGEFNILSKIVQQKQELVIFDVGANKGHWSKLVLEMNPHATIHAFEPVPETFFLMQQNIKVTNAHLHNLAISGNDGAKTFYHWDDSAQTGELSSFYRRPDVEKNMNASVKPITVHSYALDTFCRDQSIREIDFLKIDTEGAELDVMRGAASLLSSKRIRILQFEYGGTYLDSGITLKQVYELLQQYSYSVFRVIPEGLLYVPLWRNVFENYRYANYIAVAPDMMNTFRVNQVAEKVKSFISETKKHSPITTVVFSKDRAMQLDATLRSLQLRCTDADSMTVKVIYYCSTTLHNDQYEELKHIYPLAQFIPEKNFKDDLLSALSHHEYAIFLVDDNLFVRDFKLADAVTSLEKFPTAIGFSFRLGKNTAYCYMLGKQQNLPAFDHLDKIILKYNWTTADLDFGYPLELSSSLYRIKDIMPLLARIDFKNPNTLELQLETNKAAYASAQPALLCFNQSTAFCNPVNMVQAMWANKSGRNNDYTAEKLADMFAQGYRIDVKRFSDFVPNSCHQEVKLYFTASSPSRDTTPVKGNGAVVSIVVLSYNGVEQIRACLESIRRNTTESYEIIIVDNAKNDGSLEYLRTMQDIRLIQNPQNLGPAVARAQAMSIAQGDYIAFLDDDTIVTREWLTKFIAITQSKPDIGMLAAVSNYASGYQLVQNTKYTNVEEMEVFAQKHYETNKGKLTQTARLVSFCLFIKRSVANKIGTFDSRFGLFGFEDDDYSLRAHIAGFNPSVAHEIFIHHTGGPQGRGNKAYNERLFKAWEIYKKKWDIDPGVGYGKPYDTAPILTQPFDKNRHYIPLMDPCSIENLVYKKSLPQENMLPLETGNTVNAENPLYPQFTQENAIEGMTSIIIPVQSIHLDECISAIKKYTDKPHEIIFLDHGTAPKLKKQLAKAIKENSNYKVIKIDRRANFTQSLNQGISESTGGYIVLLFDDVIVCEGWLSDMLELLNRDKKIGIVGAMSDDASSLQRVEGIDFKSPEKRLSFRERNRHRSIHTRNLDGFCLLFRRDLLIRIGLFDENFGQDKHVFDDFCVRAVLGGYNNVIAGNVFVHNFGSINRLMSRDKALFDEKWIGLDASTPLAEKVLIDNSVETTSSQYHKMVQAAQTNGNWEQAIQLLTEALNLNQTNNDAVSLWNDLGYSYFMAGLPQQAEIAFSRGLEINPHNLDLLNHLASFYLHQEEYNKATDFVNRALRLNPHDVGALRTLGDCAIKLARFDVALRAYEHVKKLSPATDGIDQVIADLTRLAGAAATEPDKTAPNPAPT